MVWRFQGSALGVGDCGLRTGICGWRPEGLEFGLRVYEMGSLGTNLVATLNI